jgi:hypothetical protein
MKMVSFPPVEQADKKDYWINELESLGISPKGIERDYESESDCIKELADYVKISNRHYIKNTKLPIVKR